MRQPCGSLCLACQCSRGERVPVEERTGGLAVFDHYLVTGGSSGDVHVWDVRRLPPRLQSGTSGTAAELCQHAPASRAAAMATRVAKRKRAAPSTSAPLQVVSQHDDSGRGRAVTGLDISFDGAALLVAHASGRVQVYDLPWMMCGCGPPTKGGTGAVTSVPSGSLGLSTPLTASDYASVSELTGVSPSRPLLSAHSSECAYRYDSLTGHCRPGGRPRFSRCGRFVLSGSSDGMACMWELPRTHKRWRGCLSGVDIAPTMVLYGDGATACEVAWGGESAGSDVSDRTRVCVGGSDGCVRIWQALPSSEMLDIAPAIVKAETTGYLFRARYYSEQVHRHAPQGGLLSRRLLAYRQQSSGVAALQGTGSESTTLSRTRSANHDPLEPPTVRRSSQQSVAVWSQQQSHNSERCEPLALDLEHAE